MVMFHEDLAFSKGDMRRRRGRFELNLRIMCLPPPPRDFRDGHFTAKCAEAMITAFAKPSPAKPVNLNLLHIRIPWRV